MRYPNGKSRKIFRISRAIPTEIAGATPSDIAGENLRESPRGGPRLEPLMGEYLEGITGKISRGNIIPREISEGTARLTPAKIACEL